MHSMTGFGRGEYTSPAFHAEVEASSVNRKQAEVALSLPRGLAEVEPDLRKQALAKFSRGRLNLSVTITSLDASTSTIEIDENKARALQLAFDKLGKSLGQSLELTTQDYLRMSDQLLVEKGYPAADVLPAIQSALAQALDHLLEMRASEGANLKTDIVERLATLISLKETLAEIAPTVAPRHRELLMQRLADANLELDINDDRVLREVALFADRCDISEELTRLESHFLKVRELLDASEPVGRPLDFLCQELNREFNTIGSKANHSDIAHHIVAAKAELEKIREQVQNVE